MTTTMYCDGFCDQEFENAKQTLLANEECDWSLFAESDTVKIYRNSDEATGLFEYKLFGKLKTVAPDLFSKVYSDLKYRKSWDTYVNEANILGEDSGKELIYWQVNFPWPMSNRDYVYIREMRTLGSEGEDAKPTYVYLTRSVFQAPAPVPEPPAAVATEAAEATDKPAEEGAATGEEAAPAPAEEASEAPAAEEGASAEAAAEGAGEAKETDNAGDSNQKKTPWPELVPEPVSGVVRVSTYTTTMAFTADEQGGTKLYMYYFDNPEGNIPTFFINYAAKQGISAFLTTMQQAADKYEEYAKANPPPVTEKAEKSAEEAAPAPATEQAEAVPAAEEGEAAAS